MRPVPPLVVLLACAVAAGCAKENGPVRTYPVSGKVTYNGKAAEGVIVYLYPTNAPTVPQIPSNPRATTDADGSFTMSTYSTGDGAPEGEYQITLYWPQKNPDDEEATSDRLLGWYDIAHTKLTAQIEPRENKLPAINIAVVTRSPDTLIGIPGRN